MMTLRRARDTALALPAGIEDAADALFMERFGEVDWPVAPSGDERAAEPGILLVAVEDGTVPGFSHATAGGSRWSTTWRPVDGSRQRG